MNRIQTVTTYIVSPEQPMLKWVREEIELKADPAQGPDKFSPQNDGVFFGLDVPELENPLSLELLSTLRTLARRYHVKLVQMPLPKREDHDAEPTDFELALDAIDGFALPEEADDGPQEYNSEVWDLPDRPQFDRE